MKATELVGKKVVRTAPAVLKKGDPGYSMSFMFGSVGNELDYRYCGKPITIIKATENHIVFIDETESLLRHLSSAAPASEKKVEFSLLDCRWCDDNWTDYDELINVSKKVSK